MTSKRIRQQFLDYFASKQHTIVESSPVVPHDDPTLMFTNAGMNQFKDVFLGTGSRPYKRAADTQKCIRAGGKHNDLDDVGQDTYHHTFFEMLGNWSFGDYFKKEAIQWAWELLTKVWGIDKSRLHATYFQGDAAEGLEPDREAADLWRTATDIDPSHIHPGNKKDNFWEMGESGPCGPCSEIHIDLTPDKSGGHLVNAGDARVMEVWNLVFIQYNRASDGKLTPLPAKHVDTGMGFERLCAVIEGMRTNRIGQVSNYDTDVFTPIFAAIRKRTGAPEYKGTLPGSEPRDSSRANRPRDVNVAAPKSQSTIDDRQSTIMTDVSYRVIADHIRTLTFAITDGATPSNEGRGYVLRRILRRAVRYARQYLDMHEPFLCDIVQPLVDHMSEAFPELRKAHGGKNIQHVTEILRDEEASFLKTLDRGMRLFDEAADFALTHHHGRISGEAAFKLHDTYGFPIDLTEQMAEERSLTVDIGEYERLMDEARDRARATTAIHHLAWHEHLQGIEATQFVGYETTDIDDAFLLNVMPVEGGSLTDAMQMGKGQNGCLILSRSPFYAEQGGQVGDHGQLTCDNEGWEFAVNDTLRSGDVIAHMGSCTRGQIVAPNPFTGAFGSTNPSLDQGFHPHVQVCASVDVHRRRPTTQNHTATHILNWALREVLGEHVQQKGSLVDPEKTRFDFSHPKQLSPDELARMEALVNEQIRRGYAVYTNPEVDQKKAREINTLRAVFGEKYPEKVRVVSIGVPIGEVGSRDPNTLLGDRKNPRWMQYSVEFCGGTHLKNSQEAEEFVLVSEEAVAKGIRRVVGVTAEKAREAMRRGQQFLEIADSLRKGKGNLPPPSPRPSPGEGAGEVGGAYDLPRLLRELAEAVIPVRTRHALADQIAVLQEAAKEQEKKTAREAGRDALETVAEVLTMRAVEVNGVTVLVSEVPNATADALRSGIDYVRNKKGSSAVLLATVEGEKVTLVAGMSKDVVERDIKAGDLIKEIAPLVGGKGGGRPDLAQGGGTDSSGIGKALERAAEWLQTRLSR